MKQEQLKCKLGSVTTNCIGNNKIIIDVMFKVRFFFQLNIYIYTHTHTHGAVNNSINPWVRAI